MPGDLSSPAHIPFIIALPELLIEGLGLSPVPVSEPEFPRRLHNRDAELGRLARLSMAVEIKGLKSFAKRQIPNRRGGYEGCGRPRKRQR